MNWYSVSAPFFYYIGHTFRCCSPGFKRQQLCCKKLSVIWLPDLPASPSCTVGAPFRTVSPLTVVGVVPRVVHLVGRRYSVQVYFDSGRQRRLKRPRRRRSALECTAALVSSCEGRVVPRLCGRSCAAPLQTHLQVVIPPDVRFVVDRALVQRRVRVACSKRCRRRRVHQRSCPALWCLVPSVIR